VSRRQESRGFLKELRALRQLLTPKQAFGLSDEGCGAFRGGGSRRGRLCDHAGGASSHQQQRGNDEEAHSVLQGRAAFATKHAGESEFARSYPGQIDTREVRWTITADCARSWRVVTTQ